MNIAAMSAMVKQDSRFDQSLEGESHPGAAVPALVTEAPAAEPSAIEPPRADPPEADAAAPRVAPRKPRTRKPRPTYDDGALTRLFKFPSKSYPRSTYYVTGDEIIIRIKKARKKWKLVIPKKRVVSYKTNRWFAKPRWVELELTVTQATRLGLVEPRAPSKAEDTAGAPAGEQLPGDDAGAPMEEIDAGLDATDGAAGEAGPEVALIDESDAGGDADAADADADAYDAEADDGHEDDEPVDEQACEHEDTTWDRDAFEVEVPVASTAVIAAAMLADAQVLNAQREAALAAVASAEGEPDEPPEVPEPPRALAPVVVHVASGGEMETAGDTEIAEASTRQGVAEPTITTLFPSDPGDKIGRDLAADEPAATEPAQHVRRSRSRLAITMAAVLLMAGSATMWLLPGAPASDQFAEGSAPVEQAAAPAPPIETGSIDRPQTSPSVASDPQPASESAASRVAGRPAMREIPVLEIPDSAIEPMERAPEWPGQEPPTASLAEAKTEQGPVARPAVAAPPPEAPARPIAAAVPALPRAEPRLPAACRAMETAARSIRVQFDYASASPGEPTAALLGVFAQSLSSCGSGRVIIEGHADADGDPDRNQALSVRRAQAVWELLVKAGASPGRLSVIGYGHSRPDVPNVTPENKHKNRRVVLVVEAPG